MRTLRLALALVIVAAPAAQAHRHRAHRTRACAGANATTLPAMRSALLCLVNKQRAAHHLPALHEDRRLEASAQRWTDEMVREGFFSHGSDFASRISAEGYSWSAAGENIATGFATPRAVLAAWMGSTGHCQNILSPTYTDIGIGVTPSPVRGFGSGGATWTQDFGLPMGARAPSSNDGPAASCPYK